MIPEVPCKLPREGGNQWFHTAVKPVNHSRDQQGPMSLKVGRSEEPRISMKPRQEAKRPTGLWGALPCSLVGGKGTSSSETTPLEVLLLAMDG